MTSPEPPAHLHSKSDPPVSVQAPSVTLGKWSALSELGFLEYLMLTQMTPACLSAQWQEGHLKHTVSILCTVAAFLLTPAEGMARSGSFLTRRARAAAVTM